MFNIITGHAGYAHVTSDDWKMILIALFGVGKKIYNQHGGQGWKDEYDSGEYSGALFAKIVGPTTVRVGSGLIIDNGCAACIPPNDYQDVEFALGSQYGKRKDLLVAKYTKDAATGIEEFVLTSIKGEPADSYNECVLPEYPTGDLANGDLVDTIPLYEVWIDGFSIETLVRLFG